MLPTLRNLSSPDLPPPRVPTDPSDCSVYVEAIIGPSDGAAGDVFGFTVVTAKYLQRQEGPTWGRGLLVVQEFSWEQVRHMLERLLMHAGADTWQDVAHRLGRELHWEFENYRPG